MSNVVARVGGWGSPVGSTNGRQLPVFLIAAKSGNTTENSHTSDANSAAPAESRLTPSDPPIWRLRVWGRV